MMIQNWKVINCETNIILEKQLILEKFCII